MIAGFACSAAVVHGLRIMRNSRESLHCTTSVRPTPSTCRCSLANDLKNKVDLLSSEGSLHEDRALRRQSELATERDLSHVDIPPFSSKLGNDGPLRRRNPVTLQINIGLTCNQACQHCHVESSPSRHETMSPLVADRIVELTRLDPQIMTIDITGGAPEMHQQFRRLVRRFRELNLTVIDRCNLSVLSLPGQEDLVDFLADHQVKVVASLPCYSPQNVEKQRGSGVFESSIRGLQALNARGYGLPGSGLDLELVYNPMGAFLPPSQAQLEKEYRKELASLFGIQFTHLSCITNMPIKRFADDLRRSGRMKEYMTLLVNSFNPHTLNSVMCRDMIHVAWDGRLYDCDFNYALDLVLPSMRGDDANVGHLQKGLNVFDIAAWSDISNQVIRTGPHCYGCTAGRGSSCGGALCE